MTFDVHKNSIKEEVKGKWQQWRFVKPDCEEKVFDWAAAGIN